MSKKETFNYDVREIRLTKLADNPYFPAPKDYDKNHLIYFCLGHFDRMDIIHIENKRENTDEKQTPLQWIAEHIASEEEKGLCKTAQQVDYISPLYILHQSDSKEEKAAEQIKEFWNKPCNYLAVSRLHCDHTSPHEGDESKSIIQLLKNCVDESGDEKDCLVIPHSIGGDAHIDVNVMFYTSLELGDVVCILKSNSLSAILSEQQKIRNHYVVQDAYTYCGLSNSLLQAKEDAILDAEMLAQLNLKRVSTRLTVRDSAKARKALRKKAEELRAGQITVTYITGTADYMLEKNDISEKEFIIRVQDFFENTLKKQMIPMQSDEIPDGEKLPVECQEALKALWKCTSGQKEDAGKDKPKDVQLQHLEDCVNLIYKKQIAEKNDYDKPQESIPKCELFSTFRDIITRIGIDPNYEIVGETVEGRKKLFQQTLKHYALARVILQDARKNERMTLVFAGRLNKLLSSLQAIYDNCITDELSLLLAPALDALLERICRIYLDEIGMTADQQEEVQRFVDNCIGVMNNILHLEGQLVQHPELNFVPYYIPTMLLRYEQCLVDRYEEVLQGNGNRERKFKPILIPQSADTVATQTYLDPSSRRYDGSCPLCIFLPVQRIYDPRAIAYMLCHEIAHYCGDSLRHREERRKNILHAAASYIISFWNMWLNIDGKTLAGSETRIQKLQYEIVNHIEKQMRQEPGSEHALEYLRDIQEVLAAEMCAVGMDQQFKYMHESIVFETLPLQKQLQLTREQNSLDSENIKDTMEKLFYSHVKDCLLHLFKECYADLVMICLLKCDFEMYYDCVYSREEQKFPDSGAQETNDLKKAQIELHTTRMALLILAVSDVKRRYGLENWPDAKKGVPEKRYKQSKNWIQNALKKAEAWESRKEWISVSFPGDRNSESCLLSGEAKEILEYLHICSRKLKCSGFKYGQIRECVSYSAPESFNWASMCRFIEQEEREQINKIEPIKVEQKHKQKKRNRKKKNRLM